MDKLCSDIRTNIKRMISVSGGGHAGGSLSMVEILASLYFKVLRHDPKNPSWVERDRFILSKGHSALGLYSTLALSGYFPLKLLDTFASESGPLMNHPDAHRTPGIEVSTGSLGHGFSIAVGIALAGKLKEENHHTFSLLGDGECHEGMVWEAAMAASHFKLDSLIAIVDRNRIGNDGPIDRVMNLDPIRNKWESFGWNVEETDGHDVENITKILLDFKANGKGPSVLIAHTIKGKGLIPSLADTGKSHYLSGSKEDIENMFEDKSSCLRGEY